MISISEVKWAAGFLEGEGGFVTHQNGTSFTMSAVQLEREPLERLQRLFGGYLKGYINKRGTLVHRWTVNGAHAIAVGFMIFSDMSLRRKSQIRRMVDGWKMRPGRTNKWKTHCPRGHPYGEAGACTYKKRRYCITCYPSYAALAELERDDEAFEKERLQESEVIH